MNLKKISLTLFRAATVTDKRYITWSTVYTVSDDIIELIFSSNLKMIPGIDHHAHMKANRNIRGGDCCEISFIMAAWCNTNSPSAVVLTKNFNFKSAPPSCFIAILFRSSWHSSWKLIYESKFIYPYDLIYIITNSNCIHTFLFNWKSCHWRYWFVSRGQIYFVFNLFSTPRGIFSRYTTWTRKFNSADERLAG